jgi:glycosyltransferase involved in cell wall biosynthesis
MRVAFLNWSNRRVGGIETYLENVIPAVQGRKHSVALWTETSAPRERDPIQLPAQCPAWTVDESGLDAALAALRAWRPDVIFTHGLHQPAIERRTLDIAPAVFLAHTYHGTCVSGGKTFMRPVPMPCDRKFGVGCLVRYFPRQCGGRSPITMLRLFRQQRERLGLLRRYQAILTLSDHMRQEYLNHGLERSRVRDVKYGSAISCSPESERPEPTDGSERPWNLLFVGRMDRLKGGAELLQALPRVAQRLKQGVRLRFVGDGPERSSWESLSQVIRAGSREVDVEFSGWLDRIGVDRAYREADLLVTPSLWPEPLGLGGIDALRYGIPVAAFAVGGIPEWLKSGTNGMLAPGNPPTIEGLVEAIVGCLRDRMTHDGLRHGAVRNPSGWTFDSHVDRVIDVLGELSSARPATRDDVCR